MKNWKQTWIKKFNFYKKQFKKQKMVQTLKIVGGRWRLDETYIKIQGEWKYLYRAVDKRGDTVDFLLTKKRKRISAHKFLNKAIENNGRPELINIDKSGSNKSAIQLYNRRNWSNIEIRQCKYLNNIATNTLSITICLKRIWKITTRRLIT